MMDAVGYTRLSQESDTSIESQKQDIKEYCRDNNLDLKEVYDEGEKSSGFDASREEYARLKQEVEFGDVDAVVARDKSRLGRDSNELTRFYMLLSDKEVELHLVMDGKVDLDDPIEMAMEHMEAAISHKRKKEEIEKSRKELQKKKEQGDPLGRPPFGLQYTQDKTGFKPGDKFELVERVIQLREEGCSFPEIEEKTGVHRSQAYRILEKEDMYLEYMEEDK